MATLFRNRNRPTEYQQYQKAGMRSFALSKISGQGLMARTPDIDGAASASRQINAARNGTLLQYELGRTDEAHKMQMAQGQQSLDAAKELQPHRVRNLTLSNDAAAQGMAQSAELQPTTVRGATLRNDAAAQGIAQSAELQPTTVRGATLRNDAAAQGIAQSAELQKEWTDAAPLRKTETRTATKIAQDKELILNAQSVVQQPNGSFMVTRQDGGLEPMSPERMQAANPARIKSDTQPKIEGYATQLADAMAQGVSFTDAIASLEVPPELYAQVRQAAEGVMAQRVNGITDSDTKGARRWYKPGFMESDKATLLEQQKKNYNAGLATMGPSQGMTQQAKNTNNDVSEIVSAIQKNPNDESAKKFREWAQANQATDPRAKEIMQLLGN